MDRYVVAAVLAALAVAVAWWLSRRRTATGEPVPSSYDVPARLDRAHFDRPDTPALVVVFASTTCLACADAIERARHLASDSVAVVVSEVERDRLLHRRYGIDAVPIVVVADGEGTVAAGFVGVPPSDDLARAVADVTNDQRTGESTPT